MNHGRPAAGRPGKIARVPDMRRRSPEPPPPGRPEIQFKPGMADELLHELAPLLAGEGIDADNIDVPDLDTLQRALGRAVERHNMAMFTPIGQARELAAVTMRLTAEAIADGDTPLAASILDQAQPESPDGSSATVSACVGLALGLLDRWLSGHDTQAPAAPGQADPAACRALDRRTRRYRHPHPRPQGTRLRLPRRAHRPARRPSRPLRQRSRPRRRASGLVTTHQHPHYRPGPHRRPLAATIRLSQAVLRRWLDPPGRVSAPHVDLRGVGWEGVLAPPVAPGAATSSSKRK